MSLDDFDAELPKHDVVVLAAPLTSRTASLLTAERLDLLPRNAIVVNVARGAMLDEDGARRTSAGRSVARGRARRLPGGAAAGNQPALAASAGPFDPARVAGVAGPILAPPARSIS